MAELLLLCLMYTCSSTAAMTSFFLPVILSWHSQLWHPFDEDQAQAASSSNSPWLRSTDFPSTAKCDLRHGKATPQMSATSFLEGLIIISKSGWIDSSIPFLCRMCKTNEQMKLHWLLRNLGVFSYFIKNSVCSKRTYLTDIWVHLNIAKFFNGLLQVKSSYSCR